VIFLEKEYLKNENNYKLLLNSKKTNKLSHAYLIECRNKENSRYIYKYISKLILCDDFSDGNHIDCEICKKVDNDVYTEIEVIESETGMYKIGQLRKLQSDMSKKSIYNRPKIYVILESEKTLEKGSNSLLKFIEEPLENVYAILITDNIYKIIKTIRSRCQIIKFSDEENQINDLNNIKYEKLFDRVFDFLIGLNQDDYISKCQEYAKKETQDYYYNFFELSILIMNIIMKKKIGVNSKYPNSFEEVFIKIENSYSIEKIRRAINYFSKEIHLIRMNINTNLLIDRTIIELGGNHD
jgi:DNA polymerase III subunit delta'